MQEKLPKIVVITGPTGSGKTELSIELALKFDGEIVNADSRQIYKGLIIGTNVISDKEKKGIKHHLFQFIEPSEVFTVADYKILAIKTINDILSRQKLPIIVGGTGLYIKTVTDNLKLPAVAPNKNLRQKLNCQSAEELYQQLKTLDEEAAELIDRHNKVRLIRAIEIVLSTGLLLSRVRSIGPKLYDSLKIAIAINRQDLKKKLRQRAEVMLKKGLIEEIKGLFKKYPKDALCFNAIPYKLGIEYLDGRLTENQLIESIAFADYHYSKRQITWLKKDKEVKWVSSFEEAILIVGNFLKS